MCATARAIVRSWGCTFYEINLTASPERVAELCELSGRDCAVVPHLFLNDTAYVVTKTAARCARLFSHKKPLGPRRSAHAVGQRWAARLD